MVGVNVIWLDAEVCSWLVKGKHITSQVSRLYGKNVGKIWSKY